MTIKPVVNQKISKDDSQESSSQNLVNNGTVVRNAHRNVVLNQLSTSENQPLPREKRVHTPHNFDSENVRHRRSPHKNIGRPKRDHHHKRETRERDKNASPNYQVVIPPVNSKKQSTSSCSSPLGNAGGRSPKNTLPSTCNLNLNTGSSGNNPITATIEEALSGYNSGDEHVGQKDAQLSPDEWKERDEAFGKIMSERGLIIKDMEEDGACLFRAISLQIYGDQDMHEIIRQQTMDYIYQNREYFAQFVTEDINNYVARKRANHVHGNHIEIQAMSEMYNRSVELYCYQLEPINIFNSDQINNGNEPLRLSYQRGSHYNAIMDPYKASVGVGLGLAGYRPDEVDIKQVADAVRMSEELEIEQTMFEDKLKTTDWEATNEAIEEQIARESYLQWCRDNMRENTGKNSKSTSTITSSEVSMGGGGCSSAAACAEKSPKHSLDAATSYSESLLREFRKSTSPSSSNLSFNQGSCSSSSKGNSFELDGSLPETSCSVQYFFNNCNRRKKRNLNSPVDKPNSEVLILKKSKLTTNRPSETEAGNVASTSGGAKNDNKSRDEPVSEFYQSLLESSYTDDGFAQLSEREMLQKALAESAMDFVKRCDRTKGGSQEDKYGTTDEEYDSPSP
ncbi:OTU domain-containing protein 5-B isoform X2 [Toxorhynchites rutilus septentrionalis]|uniref:OTU domain-containing protein 5-B isoform X2 n=1 Tax=Toxorhynchites rutilus septentrionalis TaxID=329112 RepID=UPI00247897D6|nr:OTU domain-containing protein 5-B isoform X2 [Toxorhynchites rutilus septentrionalis]